MVSVPLATGICSHSRTTKVSSIGRARIADVHIGKCRSAARWISDPNGPTLSQWENMQKRLTPMSGHPTLELLAVLPPIFLCVAK